MTWCIYMFFCLKRLKAKNRRQYDDFLVLTKSKIENSTWICQQRNDLVAVSSLSAYLPLSLLRWLTDIADRPLRKAKKATAFFCSLNAVESFKGVWGNFFQKIPQYLLLLFRGAVPIDVSLIVSVVVSLIVLINMCSFFVHTGCTEVGMLLAKKLLTAHLCLFTCSLPC